jgi:predicted anti-sigma-YlaC factor YlaD
MRAGRAGPACELVRQAISAGLDGEAAGVSGAKVTVHLRRCPACREYATGASALARMVGLEPSRPVPGALSQRLASELARPADGARPAGRRLFRRTFAWRRTVQWAGALTPAALVAVFVPLGVMSSPHAVPSHTPTPCTASLPRHVRP